MANYVYIAESLDGFIATPDGGLDWLEDIPNPEGSDYGFAEFISGINALVMGRKTFEKVLSFGEWPYDRPVYVLSSHDVTAPKHLEEVVETTGGDLHTLVARLGKEGLHNLYIDGGVTIQSFLKEDLIDHLIITTIPVLLGDGVPLFGKLPQSISFNHIKTTIYNDSLVKSYYARQRE